MRDGERLSLGQIRAFLEGSEEVEFAARNQSEVRMDGANFARSGVFPAAKSGKGIVRQYIGIASAHHRKSKQTHEFVFLPYGSALTNRWSKPYQVKRDGPG